MCNVISTIFLSDFDGYNSFLKFINESLKNKGSIQVKSQLPDFVQGENPNFIAFDLLDFFQNIIVTRIYSDGNIISEINNLPLVISIGFSIAMAFFFGATTFKKFATLKTLFGLVIYIGLCIGMIYFIMENLTDKGFSRRLVENILDNIKIIKDTGRELTYMLTETNTWEDG